MIINVSSNILVSYMMEWNYTSKNLSQVTILGESPTFAEAWIAMKWLGFLCHQKLADEVHVLVSILDG